MPSSPSQPVSWDEFLSGVGVDTEDSIEYMAEPEPESAEDETFALEVEEPLTSGGTISAAATISSPVSSHFAHTLWGSSSSAPTPPTHRPRSRYADYTTAAPHVNAQSDDTYSGDDMLVGPSFGRAPDRNSLMPHPMVVGTHRVGVEIELENITTSIGRSSQYWSQIQDGSLRNHGAEFIFRAPLGGTDLFHAMVEIDSHLHKLNPDDSRRCSTHVHIDVRDMTVDQLKNMILIYAVYERVLFQCSGWQRYKNNFCVALGFAQSMMKVLSSNWNNSDSDFLVGVTHRWDKYTAMNLLPMMDKGSVEFRISEAKWRKGQLLRLCNRFLSLKELAMSWDRSQEELIEYLMNEDISKVLRKSLPRNLQNVQNDVQLGAKLAYDILYVSAMPQPTVVTGPIGAKFEIETVIPDTVDALIETVRNTRAWEVTRDRVRESRAARRLFGDLPQTQPTHMSISFLYEAFSRVSADPTWFLPRQVTAAADGELSPRARFNSYREAAALRRRG